jgi:predicted RNA methylase
MYPNLGYVNCQGEDCDAHWNYVSFKDKAVLDLGADYGSTVRYFLKKGARFIMAVEGDPKLAQELKKRYQFSSKVVCEELMISSAEDMNRLICQKRFDLAKVDIEGAEKFLLPLQSIVTIPTWLIETHSKEIDRLLIMHFQKNGFKVYRQSAINASMLKAVLDPMRVNQL